VIGGNSQVALIEIQSSICSPFALIENRLNSIPILRKSFHPTPYPQSFSKQKNSYRGKANRISIPKSRVNKLSNPDRH